MARALLISGSIYGLGPDDASALTDARITCGPGPLPRGKRIYTNASAKAYEAYAAGHPDELDLAPIGVVHRSEL